MNSGSETGVHGTLGDLEELLEAHKMLLKLAGFRATLGLSAQIYKTQQHS